MLAAAAGVLMACAAPALADVKAGVEAWSRGDYATALKEWEGPAAQGDADAQFNLAQAYKWGKGVKQDLKRAELYYGKAAAQGHLQASDEYGLLLFDRGEHAMAMPYIQAAAGRGDPRAQYLLAVASFNGDNVTKDWPRAYALMSLARGSGLPQAGPGLQQMDTFIPLAQRQQGVALAQQISAQIEATRTREFAAADLGVKPPPPGAAPFVPGAVPPQPPSPEEAVAMAEKVARGSSPATAGADYARPANPVTPPAPKPQVAKPPVAKPPLAAVPPPPPPVVPTVPAGGWRLQFGAFGVAANANALWAQLKARPELAGHPRINVPAGAVTKLQAGGFSETTARAACVRLIIARLPCIAVKN